MHNTILNEYSWEFFEFGPFSFCVRANNDDTNLEIITKIGEWEYDKIDIPFGVTLEYAKQRAAQEAQKYYNTWMAEIQNECNIK